MELVLDLILTVEASPRGLQITNSSRACFISARSKNINVNTVHKMCLYKLHLKVHLSMIIPQLAVDMSWKAMEYYVYQESAMKNEKKIFVKFGSITLNERFIGSQLKRELFRLKCTLEVNKYLLLSCRKL